MPLFPNKIETFVDLFVGGVNVSINVQASKKVCNDNLTYLIDLYQTFQKHSIEAILEYIESVIIRFKLTPLNLEGYNEFRTFYNKFKNPLDLFILICYSFNHQIRFNNQHLFNCSFGKNKGDFNKSIKDNLIKFVEKIKDFEFVCGSFEKIDISKLSENDLVYCDTPYLITTGSYNDGKRGFEGWSEKLEIKLLEFLEELNFRRIKFALSNVLERDNIVNLVLNNWINEKSFLKVHNIYSNYTNSNYQSKNLKSKEILITNY